MTFTDEQLLAILKDQAKKLNSRTPKMKETPHCDAIAKRFGSWNKALKKAGLEPLRENIKPNEYYIQLLKDWAHKHGKTPREKDFSCHSTIFKRFGSWNNAILEAGLKPRNILTKPKSSIKELSDKQLLTILKNQAKKLKRTPKRRETPNGDAIALRFDGWHKALKKANLEPLRENNKPKEYYIQLLKDWAEKHGKTPTQREFKCSGAIIDRFGSWNNAIEKADLEISINRNKSDDYYLNILIDYAKKLGRTPKFHEVPESQTLSKRFGNWNNALKLVNLTPNVEYNMSDDYYMKVLKDYANKLARTPKQTEVPHVSAIKIRFGSWHNALKKAGLKPLKEDNRSDEYYLSLLREYSQKLGRTPKIKEVKNGAAISARFGSWNKALKLAGLEPLKNEDKSKKDICAVLNDYAKKLEKTPNWHEVPHGAAIIAQFGSWNKALEYANLAPLKDVDTTIEYYFKTIKDWADENSESPTQMDFIIDPKLPDSKTIIQKTGMTWNELLLELNLEPNIVISDSVNYTDEKLWAVFQEEYFQVVPTSSAEFDEKRMKCPSATYLQKRFQMTWNQMLKKIGISDIHVYVYSEEELISELKRVANIINDVPSISDFDKHANISRGTLQNFFGSWNKAIEEAGFEIKYKSQDVVTETNEELLELYINFSKMINKSIEGATGKDLDRSNEIYNCGVFCIRFGSMNELREAAGFKIHYPIRKKYTKPELIKLLKKERIKKGRRLTTKEIGNNPHFPALSTFLRYFKTTKFSDVWTEVEKYL